MISGAARAEAAVLVIDAKRACARTAAATATMLSMLGVKQIVVCVNKMDLVDYGTKTRFRANRERVPGFFEGHRFASRAPAIHSHQRRERRKPGRRRAPSMEWYEGPMLLECLDAFEKAPPKNNRPLPPSRSGRL
jgi:bifunctional enzyme CysN/CysC